MSAPPHARALRLVTGLLRRAVLGRPPKLFDAAYYLRENPDVARSGLDPFLHYVLRGAGRGRDPSADFDTAYYRRQSGETRLDPLRHYVSTGAAAGLDPSPRFSTTLYLARYPDVAAAGANPLQHFLTDGRREGRDASPSPVSGEGLRVLDGVSPAHQWSFPDVAGARFTLRLLRALPPGPCAAFAPRLCLHLAAAGNEVEGLMHALEIFPDGAQDEIRLEIDTGATQHPPTATVILAFERAFYGLSEDGRAVFLRHAEARLWDLRPRRPTLAATFPAGSFSARNLAPGEAWTAP